MGSEMCIRDRHCTALHCTALHCTALHCTALHCTALHCTALHCTALHCTALHCTALHCTTLHCTALHKKQHNLPSSKTDRILINMSLVAQDTEGGSLIHVVPVTRYLVRQQSPGNTLRLEGNIGTAIFQYSIVR